MKITIIPSERIVTIDGRSFGDIDMTSISPTVHAVQWDGQRGEIEYEPVFDEKLGRHVTPANKAIDSMNQFQIVLDAYEQKRAAEDAPPTLERLKTLKNAEINSWRLTANNTTFTHDGKTYACDVLSRGDIDGTANHIALFGEFPPEFPGGWKATDNSFILMPTIDDFKVFYQSMTAQGTANFNRAQALKAQLFSAVTDTPEKINAIVW